MPSAIVLASIVIAAAAGLLGATPAQADSLSIGINIGSPPPPPPVVVATPPQLVVIPGTPVYYAPGLNVNFFFHKGRYYTFHESAWFVAAAYNGPWTFVAVEHVPQPILAVPVRYYKVPPGHWKKHGRPPWAGPKK
ncbi:MAG: hypothetical protein HY002_03720 [Candidatus Rokubacteria bacterium]|nr:hypothetical protein [Candidatus Rokubacteria bacterium]